MSLTIIGSSPSPPSFSGLANTWEIISVISCITCRGLLATPGSSRRSTKACCAVSSGSQISMSSARRAAPLAASTSASVWSIFMSISGQKPPTVTWYLMVRGKVIIHLTAFVTERSTSSLSGLDPDMARMRLDSALLSLLREPQSPRASVYLWWQFWIRNVSIIPRANEVTVNGVVFGMIHISGTVKKSIPITKAVNNQN